MKIILNKSIRFGDAIDFIISVNTFNSLQSWLCNQDTWLRQAPAARAAVHAAWQSTTAGY